MNKPTVLVVDTQPIFRLGLVHWLNQQPDLDCCGEAESVATARKLVEELKPALVLMEIRFHDGVGLDLLRELFESRLQIRVLVLSESEEDVYAHRVLRSGGRGYVMKSAPSEVLRTAIDTVIRGEVFLSRLTSARVLHNLFPDPLRDSKDLLALSDTELEVFRMLGSGCGPKQIASVLYNSSLSVDTFRKSLKAKLGLHNGADLIRAAIVWYETGALHLPKSGC